MKREEAIKILKDLHDKSALFSVRTALDTIIPELKESEDERIRKSLIELVKQSSEILSKSNQEGMVAWLEKQGAQKPSWSEEDSEWYMVVKESILERWKGTDNKDLIELRGGALEWLKSFKDRVLPQSKQGEQEPIDKVEPKFRVGDGITTSIEEPKNNSKFRDGDIVTIVKYNQGWTDYYIGIVIGQYIYGTDLSKVPINKALCFEIRYATEHEKRNFLSEWKELKELPYTDEEAREFADKVSHEWWQVAMDKWNTLTEDEKKKYNQYIGFNDFSDQLMNILISVLLGLKRNGKLIYEEGSLFSEPEQKLAKIELGETPTPCYEPKYFSCNGNCGYCVYKTDTGCSRKNGV